jgi:hypothetical protein
VKARCGDGLWAEVAQLGYTTPQIQRHHMDACQRQWSQMRSGTDGDSPIKQDWYDVAIEMTMWQDDARWISWFAAEGTKKDSQAEEPLGAVAVSAALRRQTGSRWGFRGGRIVASNLLVPDGGG